MLSKSLTHRIWFLTVLLMSCGLIALFSASHQNVRVNHQVFYDQFLFCIFGLGIMFFLSRFDYRRFYDFSYPFYVVNVIVLSVVLLMGKNALGATRWIEIGGLSFQPSEMTKLCLILALARYLSNRRPSLSFNFVSNLQVVIRDLILPLLMAGILALLIFKQPDLGTAILIFGIFLIMIFVNGMDKKLFFGFITGCMIVLPFTWKFLKQYQKDRLLVFMNPNIDPLGSGYTIIQSKIAIGSGLIWGKGWLSGTQNQLNFLPERHTDFIFSVIGEEWGVLGGIFLITCFFLLILTGLSVAEKINDKFGALVAIGIVGILTLQVVINIGMVMGMFPVVGITLPFISYGRTSLLSFIMMMGLLLNLSRRSSAY